MVHNCNVLFFMVEFWCIAWGGDVNIRSTNINYADEKTKSEVPRILGAEEASHSKYLFVVAIMRKEDAESKEYESCTGGVVTPNIVLTACHCVGHVVGVEVKYFDPRLMRVIAGTEKLFEDSPGRQVMNVRTFNAHWKCQFYEPGTIIDTDAALVMLKDSFEYGEYVQPLFMSENDPKALQLRLNHEIREMRVCHLPGFGLSEPDTPSSVLREAQLQLISDYDCRRIFCDKLPTGDYCNHDYDMKNQFCAVPTEEKDGATPCKGDSGAPLVCDGFVYGLLIWGGCRPEYPVVMVKGTSALELIKMYSNPNYGTFRISSSSSYIPRHVTLYLFTVMTVITGNIDSIHRRMGTDSYQ